MMTGDVVKVGCRRLGMQHRNSVGRAVFLSKGQACCCVLPNEDLPDQKCRSRLDSAHGHSQTQRLYSLWHSVTINCRITVLSEMPVTGMQTMLSRLDSAHRQSNAEIVFTLALSHDQLPYRRAVCLHKMLFGRQLWAPVW